MKVICIFKPSLNGRKISDNCNLNVSQEIKWVEWGHIDCCMEVTLEVYTPKPWTCDDFFFWLSNTESTFFLSVICYCVVLIASCCISFMFWMRSVGKYFGNYCYVVVFSWNDVQSLVCIITTALSAVYVLLQHCTPNILFGLGCSNAFFFL